MKVLGLSAGTLNGANDSLCKEALMAAKDAGAEIDRDTDEESGVFEEENDENVDFMSALISYATAVSDMTVFERMRNDGETVLRITLDDLTKAINVKREKGSYF